MIEAGALYPQNNFKWEYGIATTIYMFSNGGVVNMDMLSLMGSPHNCQLFVFVHVIAE